MLNSSLLNSAKKIIDRPGAGQFLLTARFISGNAGSQFSFSPLVIEGGMIEQDFVGSHEDMIGLAMRVSPKDYALLQEQGQNLLCILTLTYCTREGVEIFNPPPIRKQYKALIVKNRDIRMAVPDLQMYREPTETLRVQLIDPVNYALRHVKINALYPTTTVTQVIYALTQSLGIRKIHMVKADNTHSYDHISILSYQGIGSLFEHLQSNYGVYEKGLASYLSDGVLYVYPPFETAPVYDKSLLFYQVNTGHFSGSPSFHRQNGKSTSIVINTQPEGEDLSIAGAENVGTGVVFNRASRMVDGYSEMDPVNGPSFAKDTAIRLNVNSARPIEKGQHNIMHIKATDNPYPAMSLLMQHQASMFQVNWPNANPFAIDPGHRVDYYFDQDGKMVKRTGIVDNASTMITNTGKVGVKEIFEANATLDIRLSPNISRTL